MLLAMLAGCEVPQLQPPPAPPSSLIELASRGDVEGVKQRLAAGADVTEADGEGQTALHTAAKGGHLEIVTLLLDAGARLNTRDQFGFTPLHAAARDNQLAVVRTLVERGADLGALENSGLNPEQVARFMGHTDVADYLAARAPAPAAASAPTSLVHEVEEPPPPAVLLTGASFRVWTSAAGSQVEAEFVQNVLDSVTLRKRDGQIVRIALNQLIAADQVLVRQLSGYAPPVLTRTRPPAAARDAQDSIGWRIGRSSGWTVLEGCRWVRREGNDGDSFHVLHDGKEYIFRLYYVDTPESNMSYPARVREQADYFRIDENDALRLGKEAARFTERLLSRGSFTVVTRWEDARGNSRLPRHYAFVITAEGDLDELLMAEGYVRLYGMRVEGSAGSRKYQILKQLEAAARRERVGAWGVGRQAAAVR